MKAQTLKSLLRTEAYPESPRTVHLIQTHVSFLFVTDSYVYKVKKPVDFGFLNFTTLDRRRFYCHEEVRLNRRLCPDVYIGVVEVREAQGGASFAGDGRIIDYAVKMKRLPEEGMLDRLLAAGRVTAEEMKLVARTIGEFHLRAERSSAIDEFGSATAIGYNWQENFQQLNAFVGMTIQGKDLLFIREWVEAFLSENRELLAERVSNGFIRDCDGDIHLENICLTGEGVCIFDCIEFNDRFRYCDTAADIAFLLMDLDYHDSRLFSAVLLEEYVAVTGDDTCHRLLDFYKAYRAVVRGKVESFRLNDPLIPEAEKTAASERAARYFRLARGYVLRSSLPLSLIITCGLMGSGKSTIARALAVELGTDTVSSDRIRKELADIPEGEHHTVAYGTGIYDPAADDATYRALREKAEQALMSHRSIVIDATFRRRKDRLAFRALAGQYGARFVLVLAECPEKLTRQRLDERSHRPQEISDGRWELYHRQQLDFERPDAHETGFIFVNTSRPISDTIDTIIYRMRQI